MLCIGKGVVTRDNSLMVDGNRVGRLSQPSTKTLKNKEIIIEEKTLYFLFILSLLLVVVAVVVFDED